MPVFGENKQGFGVPLSQFESSTGEVVGAAFVEAFEQNPFRRLTRYAENNFGDAEMIDQNTARDFVNESGVDIQIPEEGMRSDKLGNLIAHKKDQMIRQEAIDAGRGGIALGAAKLSAAIVASFADPINLAENFIPVYGQARWAKHLNKLSPLARVAGRGAIGFAAGAQGTALTEGIAQFSGVNDDLQEDFSAAEFTQMVLLGGVLGGGMHMGMGAVTDALAKGKGVFEAQPKGDSAKLMAKLTPEQRHDINMASISQALDGRNVNPNPIIAAHRMADINAYNDLAAKANLAHAQGAGADEIAAFTKQLEGIKKRLGDDFVGPPAPKNLDESMFKGTDALDAAGTKKAVSEFRDSISKSLDEGEAVFVKAKNSDELVEVTGITKRGMLETKDGGKISATKLMKDGFDAEVRAPQIADDINASQAARLDDSGRAGPTTKLEGDPTGARALDNLNRMNQELPGSVFIDEPVFSKHKELMQEITARPPETPNSRLADAQTRVDGHLERLNEAFPELDVEAKNALELADVELKSAAERTTALKAMANCMIRGS